MKTIGLLFFLAGALRAATAPTLQELVDRTAREVQAEFAQPALKPEQLAVTVIDLRNPSRSIAASYRGDEKFYPASVIKLFFLAYTHRLMAEGRLADTTELRRGLHDMIVYSYNEATSYIVDAITGTSSGPELPPEELAAWSAKRSVVTDYFRAQGYESVNARRKPWGEGPYGRELQDMAVHLPARNSLSTNDTARLLEEIALGRCVSPARSAQMLELLARDPTKAVPGDPDDQATGFTGPALAPGMKLWSKAGWVSWARHDAALIQLPDGGRIIIVTFTDGKEHSANRAIIASVARRILAALPPVL
jgi:beta-lactamase class A